MKCNNSVYFLAFSTIILIIFTILIMLDWFDTLETNFDFDCDNEQLYNFLIILGTVISILLIHFFFINRTIKSQNILSKLTSEFYQIYHKSSFVTSIWRLTHFVMAFLVGIFAPCYWKEIIWLQTLWEVIECSTYTQSFFKKIWKLSPNSCLTSCGSWGDLAANYSGIVIGLICRKYVL